MTAFSRVALYSSLIGIGIWTTDNQFNSNQFLHSITAMAPSMFIGTNVFTSSSNTDGHKIDKKAYLQHTQHRKEDKSKRPKVGLGCLILRKNADNQLEFLVGIRKSAHGAGLYALPGGHLEYGETWGQCAYHEVLEETNLKIPPSKWKFAFANNSIAPSKNNSDEYLHYIDIIMSAIYDDDEEPINMEPHKCEGWQWMKWNEHNLDTNRTFCGLKAILESDHFHPEHDYAKFVSYDQWQQMKSTD